MAVVVREQGKKYYKVHRVLFEDKIKRSSSERAGAVSKNTGSSPAVTTSETIISNDSKNVNSQIMQNSQEDAPKKIDSRKDVDDSVQSQELKNWFGDWRKNAVIYKDKLTASNNLDEIVLASTNYLNEDLKHQRKDNIVEFARGEVLMQIGNNKYNAKVIVGLTKNNKMLLYDIVKFKKDIFKIKKEDAFTDQNVNKEVSRHYASSDKMISQNDSYVNNNSMQNSQEDAQKKIESRKDVDDSVHSQELMILTKLVSQAKHKHIHI